MSDIEFVYLSVKVSNSNATCSWTNVAITQPKRSHSSLLRKQIRTRVLLYKYLLNLYYLAARSNYKRLKALPKLLTFNECLLSNFHYLYSRTVSTAIYEISNLRMYPCRTDFIVFFPKCRYSIRLLKNRYY